MIVCQACSTTNSDMSHFCRSCAALLWRRCSACGSVLPAAARFCGSCGAAQPKEAPAGAARNVLTFPDIKPEKWFKGRRLLLDRFPPLLTTVLNREGQTVLVSGEPGVGKTALISQALRYAESNGARTFHLRGDIHGRYLLWWPVLELIDQLCVIEPGDDIEVISTRLGALKTLGLDDAERACIAELFGVSAAASVRDEEGSDRYLTAVNNILFKLVRNLAVEKPLALAWDESAWFDAATLRFLQGLVDLCPGMRLLLIIEASNPEASVFKRKFVHMMDVGPLEARDLLKLGETDRRVRKLPDDMMQNVFSRSNGNPARLAHLSQYCYDADMVRIVDNRPFIDPEKAAMALPSDLPEVIKARLSLLAPSRRDLLILLMLLGSENSEAVCSSLMRSKDSFSADVAFLQEHGWIEPRGTEPPTYRIIDSAVVSQLESLVTAQLKASLQPAIARVLMEYNEGALWRREPLVCLHLSQAAPTSFEAHYALERLAGQMAERRQWTLVLTALYRVSVIVRTFIQERQQPQYLADRRIMEQKLLEVLLRLGGAYLRQGQMERALKTYEIGIDLTRSYTLPHLLIDYISRLTPVRLSLKQFAEAHKQIDNAMQIAQKVKMDVAIARLLFLKAQTHEAEGRLKPAAEAYRECLAQAERNGQDINPEDILIHKAALGMAMVLLRQKEPPEKMTDLLIKAYDVSKALGDFESLQHVYELLGRYCHVKNDLVGAVENNERALAAARAVMNIQELARLSYLSGFYRLMQNARDEALALFSESLSLAQRCDWFNGVDLAEAALRKIQSGGSSGIWSIPDLTVQQ